MYNGKRITDLSEIAEIPEGSSYLVEAGDGSGTKRVKHETVVSEIGKALPVGDMDELTELEEFEELGVTEKQADEEEQKEPGKKEKFTITKAILKVFHMAAAIFTGTDGIKAGTAGIVPAPEPEDEGKVLGANGEWVEGPATTADSVKFKDGKTAEEKLEAIVNRLTPVGHILAYMGTTAPQSYLICDGTVYNISTYKTLAEHIKTQFGRYDYWGGDGTTTFAVPDLRAEFLRGSGTAARNTGSGAAVGVHQDATSIPAIYNYQGQNIIQMRSKSASGSTEASRADFTESGGTYTNASKLTVSTDSSNMVYAYTARPTNTAVLYCIKYQ